MSFKIWEEIIWRHPWEIAAQVFYSLLFTMNGNFQYFPKWASKARQRCYNKVAVKFLNKVFFFLFLKKISCTMTMENGFIIKITIEKNLGEKPDRRQQNVLEENFRRVWKYSKRGMYWNVFKIFLSYATLKRQLLKATHWNITTFFDLNMSRDEFATGGHRFTDRKIQWSQHWCSFDESLICCMFFRISNYQFICAFHTIKFKALRLL